MCQDYCEVSASCIDKMVHTACPSIIHNLSIYNEILLLSYIHNREKVKTKDKLKMKRRGENNDDNRGNKNDKKENKKRNTQGDKRMREWNVGEE